MPSKSRPAGVISREGRGNPRQEQEISTVEIDSTFAKLLGLGEGQKMGVFLHLDPPVAHTVNIEPLTPGDWEVIELHATFLELNFLSQVRALPNPTFSSTASVQAEYSHPLTLHLSPTSTANIIVTSLVPPVPNTSPFAKIAADAEVVVAPKVRPKSGRAVRGDSRSVVSRRSGKSGVSTARPRSARKSSDGRAATFLRGVDRAVAQNWFKGPSDEEQNEGLRIWLSKDVMASNSLRGTAWVKVSIVKPAGLRGQLDQGQVQKLKDAEASESGLPASVVVARMLSWSTPPDPQHVALSSELCKMLDVERFTGQIVRLQAAPYPMQRMSLKSIKVHPFLPDTSARREGLKFGGESRTSRQSTADKIAMAYGGDDGLLAGPLTDGMVLPPSDSANASLAFSGGILRLDPPAAKDPESGESFQWVVGAEQKQHIDVQTETPRPLPLTTIFPSFEHSVPEQLPELVGIEPIIKTCMSNLSLCSSVLLTGGIGSGKTSLAHVLCKQLRQDYLFNTTYFSCRKLVADETRVSSIKEALTKLFLSASWCSRLGGQSVVVLDDVDRICPLETELETGDNGRSRQISELLCSIVREYCSVRSGVALLATAQSKDALNNIIIGGHVVGDIVSLKAPDKECRRKILQRILGKDSNSSTNTSYLVNGHSHASSNGSSIPHDAWMNPSLPSSRPGSSSASPIDGFQLSSSLDLLDLAGKTDGYMPSDLVLLVSRARNEALIRTLSASTDSQLTLTTADFTSALRNFTPTSLRNVPLTHSTTTFSSIGGLKSTRDTLLETLLYPTKYAPIFARSPLRLRSGLLLYGYPGCGKTLLASAVAGECGLNFISVKGPEILNKYIGASEKSVRDLFERAQAAKPCVLFFDEFDSIAPKRGHDSTGVTDRVVNQMLTQMDGAEGLEGVYVLAATSRPDLIDPALLRPGRLDKSLLCDMPSEEDRLDILQAVCKDKVKLLPDVHAKLSEIAKMTEGYSGADLQALVYNAHLEAIHDLIGDESAPRSSTNGTKTSHRNDKRKHHKTEKHDFIQFLYSATEDAAARASLASKALDSNAEIAAKLEALKLAKKREKALRRPAGYASGHRAAEAAEKEEQKDEVWIQWKHVERSLASTRSSISKEERGRLAAIYNEFVVGRNGEMPSGDGGREIGGRSSLM